MAMAMEWLLQSRANSEYTSNSCTSRVLLSTKQQTKRSLNHTQAFTTGVGMYHTYGMSGRYVSKQVLGDRVASELVKIKDAKPCTRSNSSVCMGTAVAWTDADKA